ncbi:MAG TPA: glycosyltransferase family 2 protein [Actinomycetota bacterium]|nr:glycosyltransferase family 2 protein [Actinomycetota bacterium]
MTDAPQAAPRVVALVAAYNEEGRIGRTVKALRALDDIDHVMVVADGSTDRTVEEALVAGAAVLRAARRTGKGDALDAALDRIRLADVYVLVDGDVGDSAAQAAKLLAPVLGGRLDLAVGSLPAQPGGGFGFVKRMARSLIRRAGFDPHEPLSGQRAVSREALHAARPLARRFGTEVGMTMDLVRLGFRIGEIPVEMTHRPTGRNVGGFIHRGRQGADILRAAVPRLVGVR